MLRCLLMRYLIIDVLFIFRVNKLCILVVVLAIGGRQVSFVMFGLINCNDILLLVVRVRGCDCCDIFLHCFLISCL